MVEDHELTVDGVDHRDTGLPTHQEGPEVVPRPMGVGRAVHERVEGAVGHRAEIEGHRPHRPELTPSQVARGKPREPDHGIAEIGAPRGGERLTVDEGPATSLGLIGATADEVADQGSPRAVGVDGAEARRVPGQPPGGVRGAVERIDDHDHPGIEAPGARFLTQHPHPGACEHRVDRGVGDEVAAVLPEPLTGGTPVRQRGQRIGHRIRSRSKQCPQLVVVHLCSHVRNVAPPWQARDVAAIDVAGFIADLKDHAVDHGFHVHDERHFVESYSLRQAWEVDLHPEEACGGPLDLHLSLEVDPRVLLSFEDKVLELPETDEPPDEFHFPMLFTWALPPLPMGPDLLVLATELAGVGGPDLPLEVSAIDSFAAVTDAPERSLAIVARIEVSLAKVFLGQELLCEILDRCLAVSQYLLDRAPVWLDEV